MFEYVYSTNKKVLHNENCRYVKKISVDHSQYTTSLFKSYGVGYNVCKCCGLATVLRRYADVAEHEIEGCVSILRANNIDAEFLRDYFVYYKASMRYSNGTFYLKGKEDNWVLRMEGDMPVLLHNNYRYQKGMQSRYFVNGFHRQELYENSMRFAMRHAATYSFNHYIVMDTETADEKNEYVAKKRNPKAAIRMIAKATRKNNGVRFCMIKDPEYIVC